MNLGEESKWLYSHGKVSGLGTNEESRKTRILIGGDFCVTERDSYRTRLYDIVHRFAGPS